MKHVRVCIVGAGPMGRLHAQKVARFAAGGDASEIAAIVDHHAARAAAVVAESGGRVVEDLDQALVAADVAIVAVPTANHAVIADRALRAGLDVLVEKPMAGDVKEAESLIERAATQERILQVGHVEWYNAAWREAVARAGTLQRIEVDRMNTASERGLDLDVVQDLMLHDLDWVTRSIGEEVVEFAAEGACVATSRLDVAAVQLEFASGCIATLRASRVHSERRRRMRIVGSEGTQTVDFSQRPAAKLDSSTAPATLAITPDPLERQWAGFLAAVRTRGTPENSGEVGLEALRWVERVRARIAEGEGAGG